MVSSNTRGWCPNPLGSFRYDRGAEAMAVAGPQLGSICPPIVPNRQLQQFCFGKIRGTLEGDIDYDVLLHWFHGYKIATAHWEQVTFPAISDVVIRFLNLALSISDNHEHRPVEAYATTSRPRPECP